MIKYFFKIGLRSVFKYRNVSLIGILSLTTGIAVLLLIALYSRNELSMDSFHKKAAQIYKVSYGNSSATPGPLSNLLLNTFPEIQDATHIETHQLFAFSPVINYNNHPFEIERYYSADSSFLKVFDFEVIHGEINSALGTAFSVILTESEAMRIFNTSNPVGETITWKIYGDFTFTVMAIVSDPPQNSSIRFNGLISEASLVNMGRKYYEDWGYTVFETYLLINSGVNSSELERKLREYLIEYYKINLSTRACYADAASNPLELHEIKGVYFNERLTNDTTNRGNLLQIQILIAVGIIIMLLSIINYINLSVAKATTRSKEIGVQKVCGSSKRSLIVQYLTETTIISFIAAIIGLAIAMMILPGFSQFMNLDQSLGFSNSILLTMIPGVLLLGILAGIYPAFVVSSQKTVEMLKKRSYHRNKGLILRYALIIFQFAVSIILIANTYLINKQLLFLNNKDLGICKEQVIYAKLPFQLMRGGKEIFRERVLELSDVQKAGFSSTIFGKIENSNNMDINGKMVNFTSIWVDAAFVDLYDLELSKGRFFSKELISDVNTTALINESAVREFNVEDPFQIKIRVPGGEAQVVGIVRDFNFNSLHNRIDPMAIVYLPGQGGWVNIKIGDNNPLETLDKIEEIWNDLAPGFPFSYQFLDSSFEMLYRKEEQMGEAIMYFSLIAIAIAILGILSLTLFMCEKRVKELGIRKINGAKSWNILLLINKNFLVIIAAAFVIACPVARYTMTKWLESFAYKTSIGIWPFIVSGFLVSIVTLTMVSWQSWRFANRNPVDALRYE